MTRNKAHSEGLSTNEGSSSGPSTNEGSSSGNNSQNLDQLNSSMADVNIDSTEDSGWEVIARKSKNRSGSANAKPWGSLQTAPTAYGQSQHLPQKGWGSNSRPGRSTQNVKSQPMDSRKEAGRANPNSQQSNKNWKSANMAPSHEIPPPLQHGWQWGSRDDSSDTQPQIQETTIPNVDIDSSDSSHTSDESSNVSDDDDELVDDSDDDFCDDYDSDESQKSHGTRKKNKWLKVFFETLDCLTGDEINEQSRQWHCPACHDGPGAIAWYKGMQPLMAHAKTKGATRLRLHREFAELLEEELHIRGVSVIPGSEAFGKWKGLRETTADHEIVWPPMVVIANTQLDKDENDKWLGMGNQELVEYFNTYAAVKARSSYGPSGHRGMSVLIFEANAIGYLEAERLDKQFADEGRGRDAWERCWTKFVPGGKRQLYGYLASKADMDSFNRHSHRKEGLKFEVKSYQEMVVTPIRQMSEDNQQLIRLKNKVVKQEKYSKTLEKSFGLVSQKLRETAEENRIVRLRTKMQHEQNKEEMDDQERFIDEQMDKINEATEEKEEAFEKRLQEERARWLNTYSGTGDDLEERKEEIEKLIIGQVKGVEGFEAAREKLIKMHRDKEVELKRKHRQEDIDLAMEFHTALTKLMEQYAPKTSDAASSA